MDAAGSIGRLESRLTSFAMKGAGDGRAFVQSLLTDWPERIGSTWVSNVWDEMSIHVDPHRGAMAEVFAAATNDLIQIDLPLERDHINTKFGHAVKLSYVTKMARAMALMDLNAGDSRSALQTLVDALRLLERFRGAPYAVPWFRGFGAGHLPTATW